MDDHDTTAQAASLTLQDLSVEGLLSRASKLLVKHSELIFELVKHNRSQQRRIEVLEGRVEALENGGTR
jgi:hypothetical protein